MIARDALLRGDIDALRAALDADPALATARCDSTQGPYCGYFYRATLLHHVAGNPSIDDLPQPTNDRDLVDLLLERGAELDALTAAGPAQPDDIGWTTLGLVATSGRAGQLDLLDHLVAAGADLDAPGRGALRGALYYDQTAAAERLVVHGARVDFFCACGLGRLDLVDDELTGGVDALVDRPRSAHYSQVSLPEHPDGWDLVAIGLAVAAQHGRTAVIARLLELGADPNRRPWYDHRATALHWAVLGDRSESVTALLTAGADPSLRDTSFDSTPRGWAEHLGKSAALAAFPS